MTNHNLLPEHGEEVFLNLKYDRQKDKIQRVMNLQQEATLGLAALLVINDDDIMKIICKQCMLDVSLIFRDLSEAIKELVE